MSAFSAHSGLRRSRTARLGHPAPQVLEDAPDNLGIVDQGHDAHGPLALWALQRIGRVDLADQSRPGRLDSGDELTLRLGARGGPCRGAIATCRFGPLPARAVRVPPDAAVPGARSGPGRGAAAAPATP